MGKTCEVDVDDCAGSPCHHGSTCNDHVNSFSCSCLPGYTGSLCEVNYNECGSSPCRNGGICADGVNAYLCVCKSGFTGENCEVDIDDCNQAPCENEGEKVTGFSSHLPVIAVHWTKVGKTFLICKCTGQITIIPTEVQKPVLQLQNSSGTMLVIRFKMRWVVRANAIPLVCFTAQLIFLRIKY